MPHFLISYDLNGPNPTHATVDRALKQISSRYGRILETVWYVQYAGSIDRLSENVNRLLSSNDRLMVAKVADVKWRNLLVGDAELRKSLASA